MTDSVEEPPRFYIRRASEMPVPAHPTWLASGYLPNREITVLVGEEGIGKSLTWVVLVMHITRGLPMPEFNLPRRTPADVVLVLTEDSWAEVRQRLLVTGADLARVHVFSEDEDGSGSPVFPAQQDVLLAWATAHRIAPAMIVVDAWLDTVPAGTAVRDTQSGRAALAPWKIIATKLDTAVLLVTHTNRLGTANTRDLIGSTIALRQKARMVLFAARRPGDGDDGGPHHVWIGPEKANTTGMRNAVRFEISIEQARVRTDDDPGTVATLVAAQLEQQTIRELVAEWRRDQDDQVSSRKQSAAETAETFVLAYMLRRGVDTVLSKEVQSAARSGGHGEKAVSAAMRALGTSTPVGPGQPWIYRLTQSRQREPVLPDPADTADTADTAEIGGVVSAVSAVSALRSSTSSPAETGRVPA